ncbi:MAG: phosphoserine phosphatase SerB, partial [Alphaproteobacteria bacterium RIFOXYD12_FULL_60_8]
ETGHPDWLAPFEACDIPFHGLYPHEAQKAVATALKGHNLDVIAQPAPGRRKRLLIADMDSTIVTGETLDDLAAFAGIRDKIAAITARAMNGELDFKDALRERVGMLKGLPTTCLEETWAHTTLTPGALTLVKTMRTNGAHCLLVSGGFDFFTGRVRDLCGFHEDRSNRFVIENDALTGRVVEPILDKEAKINALLEASAQLEIAVEETLAVGDGANDLPMILAAGLGIAFRAKPSVVAQARHAIINSDLTGLLYAQGYRAEEFVT